MARVLAGAERWSAPGASGPAGDIGLLLLHGFTGNPVSMRPLGEELADRGFAVELPRLPGHGTHWRDLQRTTWREWAAGARAALAGLRTRTRVQAVVGLSGGATLALHLAAGGEPFAGVVAINPFLTVSDPRLRLLPVLKHVVGSLPGVGNDIAKPGADERAYDRLPLRAFASVLQLQDEVRAALPRVTAPLLVFTSRADHVVAPSDSALLVERVGSRQVEHRWLERSYHVATLDHDLPQIVSGTAQFVSRLA